MTKESLVIGVYLENLTKPFGEFSTPQVTTDDDRNHWS